MKKLLLPVAGLVVATGVVVGGTNAIDSHYQNSQKQKTAPVATVSKSQADSQVASVRAAAAADHQSLVEQFNRQTAECQKGLQAYVKLTPFIKAQTVAPLCAAPLAP